MRIDRLDLLAYGQFTDKTLDLSDGEAGLHLVYGDNEAGKSTSLRALTALLFGIPARTEDNFLHRNQKLRIGGKLRLSNGRAIEFVRRKGRKGTLLDRRTSAVLEDAVLAPFLTPGIDENLFKQLYGINHSRLVAGGQELLSQSGDIGQALFSAAVGSEGLRDILLELQDSADALFKPQASTRVINQAIAAFRSAQKQVRESSLPVSEWKRLQAELAGTLFEIEKIETSIVASNREKSQFARVSRVKGALAERRSVLASLEGLGDALVLPEDFDDKRKAALSRYQAATETREKAQVKLKRLAEESDSIKIRQELLDNEEEIRRLFKELGAVEKTIQDRPQQDGKRRLLRSEAAILLKGVRPDLDLGEADQLRPLLNNKKWISSLAQQYVLLNQKQKDLEDGMKAVQDEQKSLLKQVSEQHCSAVNLGEIKAAVSTARKSGDIERRLLELQKRSAEEQERCASERARLGRYRGTVETLSTMALPLPETVDSFERQMDGWLEKQKELERNRQERSEELARAEQQLHALLLTGTVPAASELQELRLLRDRGWHLIKARFIEQRPVDREIAAYTPPGSDLVSTFEERVKKADYLSDQLRVAADQVVKRADLEAAVTGLKSRLETLDRDLDASAAELQEINRKWEAVWSPLGVEAGKPREMKQWLVRVEKLLAQLQTARNAAIDEERLAAEQRALHELILPQLETFLDAPNLREMSLEAMISRCEQFVAQEEGQRERRYRLEHEIERAEIRLKRTAENLELVRRDKELWLQEWTQASEGLGLEPDAHPERAVGAIGQLESFFDALDRSEALRRRIYGMDQVEQEFINRVHEFTDTIGFGREGQEASLIAAQLHQSLNETRELRASLIKNEIQRNELAMEIEETDITIRQTAEQLALLRAQAGAETDDELVAVCERSIRKRALLSKYEMLEQELIRNGDGLSIAELEYEAGELDFDALDGEQQRITVELEELHAERDHLRDQRQTLQNEIQSKDGNARAAEASEEMEEQRAQILAGTEQYLRFRIAALILDQQIEKYRRQNQAPVLARAAHFFSKLTLGSYSNLRDELDDSGRPVLLGVRPDAAEVTIAGMSDGTRDQLYLSLRLATLEMHLKKGEPLPFIVDDILVAFDDSRTRACLDVLAELSATTQVLLFTHHRRVAELADSLPTRENIFLHEL